MPRKRVNRRKQTKQPKREFRLPTIDWSRLVNGTLLLMIGAGTWAATSWLLERPINSVRVDGPFERVSGDLRVFVHDLAAQDTAARFEIEQETDRARLEATVR